MTVTQTVNIPASHKLTIDVPGEIPTGLADITFTPSIKRKPGTDPFYAVPHLSMAGLQTQHIF